MGCKHRNTTGTSSDWVTLRIVGLQNASSMWTKHPQGEQRSWVHLNASMTDTNTGRRASCPQLARPTTTKTNSPTWPSSRRLTSIPCLYTERSSVGPLHFSLCPQCIYWVILVGGQDLCRPAADWLPTLHSCQVWPIVRCMCRRGNH